MKVRITVSGAKHDIGVTYGTQVAWERHFGRAISTMAEGTSAENIAFLAWDAAKRAGVTPLDFDGFLDTLEDIDMISDEGPQSAGSVQPTG